MQSSSPFPLNILSFLVKLLISLAAIFLYTRLAGPIPFSVNNINTNKTDAFSVTGTGKSSLKPTMATLNAGVTATGIDVKSVQNEMNTKINKVTDSLKNAGVDQKDIQTQNYSVNPNYDYAGGPQKINGYTASTNLVIKINDIQKANQIIDLVTQNGANQVGGLNFDNADKSAAENEARKMAVEDAKKKATSASQIAGFKLGKVINYQEDQNGERPPIAYAADSLKSQGNATNVEPGTNEIIVNVTLSYEVQ